MSLKGKKAFIAGIADDNGFGWSIAKELAENGCEIIVGTWAPLYKIFTSAIELGKFEDSQRLSDGSLLKFSKIYPMDAVFDKKEDIPQEILDNKRYRELDSYTISEIAKAIEIDFGKIDLLIHCMANGPEVKKPLLETSRHGYLAAISSSSFSFISLVQHFGPIMNEGGAGLTLSFLASTRTVPGYGGGMSSAKAALESDTRTLAWEAGRKWRLRINSISAGPVKSRAAKAIGFIDKMIDYYRQNAPLKEELNTHEVGKAAKFLLSDDASAITGTTLYVDKGLHSMAVANLEEENSSTHEKQYAHESV